MLCLCVLVTVLSGFHSGSGQQHPTRVYSPGDIIIGGLFPIHTKNNRTKTPGPVSCSDYSVSVFLRSQLMIYAIQEMNQRTKKLLPNFTIGYDIYDTCGDVSLTMRATLLLLKNQSDNQTCLQPSSIHTALPEPRTKVVIGESTSERSIVVARLVALSSVAQISYASTSERLSNKFKYPTFFRTISSDKYQTKVIAELASLYRWDIVGVVGSDDAYGRYGSERLMDNFDHLKICVDFMEVLPSDFSGDNPQSNKTLADLVEVIKKSPAEAIVLFTKTSNAKLIITAAIKSSLNRTWIASDSWSTSKRVSSLTDIRLAGRVFGISPQRNDVPGFRNYILSKFNGTTNAFLEHLEHLSCSNQSVRSKVACNLTCSQQGRKHCLDYRGLVNYAGHNYMSNLYFAFQVIHKALIGLLKCDEQHCQRDPKFTSLELVEEIKKVNFTVNTSHIYFDSHGDPRLGYDIVYWKTNETSQETQIETIGEYRPNETVNLSKEIGDMDEKSYGCSDTCHPGKQLKIKDGEKCCKECVPCADGEFSPAGGKECESCPEEKYSSPEKDKCLEKLIEVLEWTDPLVIVLLSFQALGIIADIGIVILFSIYHNTPVVKAVGGYLSFLELLALLTCLCVPFTMIGEPTKASCMMGWPLFGVALSFCNSCILSNLLQIYLGFRFDLNSTSRIKKLYQPVLVVTVVSGIQVALCGVWLGYYPPTPHEEILTDSIVIQCSNKSDVFMHAMIGYSGILTLICFAFAFKSKKLPDLYKNATLISISMALYLVIWAIFIGTHQKLFRKAKLLQIGLAIVISAYSILCCHFAPKCYIILFQKDINNERAVTEYIRRYYESRDLPVVGS